MCADLSLSVQIALKATQLYQNSIRAVLCKPLCGIEMLCQYKHQILTALILVLLLSLNNLLHGPFVSRDAFGWYKILYHDLFLEVFVQRIIGILICPLP